MEIEESKTKIDGNQAIEAQPLEWGSDHKILADYIRQNLSLGPKTIQIKMRQLKQSFTLQVIKTTKKAIFEEVFPRDKKVAFHPNNCLILGSENNREDNLFKYSAQFPIYSQNPLQNSFNLQEFHIFATNTMLYQMELSHQWFIDGTFSVAPSGFQQLITIIVYINDHKIFYPGCFILATNKSQKLYQYALQALVSVADEEGFKFKPKTIMTDFEQGLRNAIKSIFKISDSGENETNLVGCYFHFVKAIIKKAKQLGCFRKGQPNIKTKGFNRTFEDISPLPIRS